MLSAAAAVAVVGHGGPVTGGVTEESLVGPRLRATTVALVMSTGVVAFDELGVTTALPRIAGDLGGRATFGWAVSAVVLATVVGAAAGGRVADRHGPRTPTAVGFVVFVVGVVCSGAAGGWAVFLLGRFVQGLGAGTVIAMLYVVVTLRVPDRLRARALAALSAAWTVPALVGPSLSGLLVETVGWRAVFALLAVLTLVAGALTTAVLRGLGPATTDHVRGATAAATTVWACVLAAGVGAVLVALDLGRPLPGAVLAASGLAAAGIALRRVTPPGTLRARRGLPAGLVARGVSCAAFFGAGTFLALLLVEVRGAGTTLVGAVLSAGSLAWSLGAALQARGERRRGPAVRARQVVVGHAVLALGLASVAVTLLGTTWPPATVAVGWAAAGLGMGVAYNVTTAATFDLSTRHGATSASLQITQTLGIALAAGVGTAQLAAVPGDPALGGTLLFAVVIGCAVAAGPLAWRLVACGVRTSRP